MNRELYIHTLSQFRDECERKHMDTETEAFNAAIQALSADGDCISRQAAIAEIDEWIKAFRENGHKESAADARLIQDGIIQLPSVQPEIIRCKDCSKWKTIHCPFFSKYITVMPNEEQYCSYAERITDG